MTLKRSQWRLLLLVSPLFLHSTYYYYYYYYCILWFLYIYHGLWTLEIGVFPSCSCLVDCSLLLFDYLLLIRTLVRRSDDGTCTRTYTHPWRPYMNCTWSKYSNIFVMELPEANIYTQRTILGNMIALYIIVLFMQWGLHYNVILIHDLTRGPLFSTCLTQRFLKPTFMVNMS